MKIAICVSGQTRNHNTYSSRWLEDINHLFADYEYDLYGHTWVGQPKPVTSRFREPFKGLCFDDQTIIDDWVKRDHITNGFYDKAWSDNPEWKNIVKDGKAFDHILATSRMAYGQFVSTFLCMQQVKGDYDAVVRYRWDIGLRDRNISRLQEDIELFVGNRSKHFSELVHRDPDATMPNEIAYAGSWADVMVSYPFIDNQYVPDYMFVFDKKILDIVKSIQWPDILIDKPQAHSGWTKVFKALKLITIAGMQDKFTLLEDRDKTFQHLWQC